MRLSPREKLRCSEKSPKAIVIETLRKNFLSRKRPSRSTSNTSWKSSGPPIGHKPWLSASAAASSSFSHKKAHKAQNWFCAFCASLWHNSVLVQFEAECLEFSRLCTKSLYSASSLCNLCVLCVSVVVFSEQ